VTRRPDLHAAVPAFSDVADAYERGRATYPADGVAWLCEALAIAPGTRVLDLAAGTGKLTRLLVASGADVVAVEPLAEMRAGLTGVEALDGIAEAIPLRDASVDAVTVAQGFHWFDGERALAEIHRVLRPGGGLGLIWNRADTRVEWVARLDEVILSAPWDDIPRFRRMTWRRPFADTTLFTPLEEQVFEHAVDADAEAIRARVESISFVARLPEDERAALLARVDEITDGLPRRFPSPYRTFVYACRRIP
jgi:ubiquinone/menaquinone biosynthesis C-methylase UbiE